VRDRAKRANGSKQKDLGVHEGDNSRSSQQRPRNYNSNESAIPPSKREQTGRDNEPDQAEQRD
jgi:hypothetical protein